MSNITRQMQGGQPSHTISYADMEQQLEQVRTRFLQRSAGEYRDSSAARGGLVQGLENLRNRANEMANKDTTAIVEQFGQMGRRRFDLVA